MPRKGQRMKWLLCVAFNDCVGVGGKKSGSREARLETAERTKGVFFRNGGLGYVFRNKGLADQVAVSKENNQE